MYKDTFAQMKIFSQRVTFAWRNFYTEGHFCTKGNFYMRVEKQENIKIQKS